MKNTKELTVFEGKSVRRIWDEKKELWYFSVVDVIAILTGSINHRFIGVYSKSV